MEEKAPAPHSAPPQHAPVVDVVPPTAVRPEPSAEKTGHKDNPEPAPPNKDAKAKPQKPAAPKKESKGVGVAITATVIIVLGLAAMATYAFIKTQN